MKTILFDFTTIKKIADFYRDYKKQCDLPSNLVNNLDGLWDSLIGMIELPVVIEFHNMTLDQLDKFENLINILEEAEEETNNEIKFSYYITKNN